MTERCLLQKEAWEKMREMFGESKPEPEFDECDDTEPESPEENGSLTGWGSSMACDNILAHDASCSSMVTKAYIDQNLHLGPDAYIDLPSGEANLVDMLLRMQEEIAHLKERLQMNEVEATPRVENPCCEILLEDQPTEKNTSEENWNHAYALGMVY